MLIITRIPETKTDLIVVNCLQPSKISNGSSVPVANCPLAKYSAIMIEVVSTMPKRPS